MACYRIISSERLQAAACSDHFDTKIVDIRDGLAMLLGNRHCEYIISRLKIKKYEKLQKISFFCFLWVVLGVNWLWSGILITLFDWNCGKWKTIKFYSKITFVRENLNLSQPSNIRAAITIELMNTVGFFVKWVSTFFRFVHVNVFTNSAFCFVVDHVTIADWWDGAYRALPVGLNSKTSQVSHVSCMNSPILGYFSRKKAHRFITTYMMQWFIARRRKLCPADLQIW